MKLNSKIFGVIVLILWVLITLLRVSHHQPWYDEAHAWLISQELNLWEIIPISNSIKNQNNKNEISYANYSKYKKFKNIKYIFNY